MKRKQLILSFSLGLTVLFSILIQSFHSYEHLEKQLSHKFCVHDHSKNKVEFTHQHKVFEHCAVCQFAFGSCLQAKLTAYHFFSAFQSIHFLDLKKEEIISFSGCLYTHRGPPACIV